MLTATDAASAAERLRSSYSAKPIGSMKQRTLRFRDLYILSGKQLKARLALPPRPRTHSAGRTANSCKHKPTPMAGAFRSWLKGTKSAYSGIGFALGKFEVSNRSSAISHFK